MNMIEEALRQTTDTRACVIGAGATEAAAGMFREIFPGAKKAVVVDDPRTRAVAGGRVRALLEKAGVETVEHVVCPGGEPFHAEYRWVDEVRGAVAAAGAVPVAVGSGTINDTVKLSSDQLGLRYMVVGTAASMDGYTSYGASITKDGIKQTMPCRAPLGCIVDSAVAAAAPGEMTASGYADLIAKVPAGADWMLAAAVGSEAIHADAWRFVQEPLRDSLKNPAGCAAGDVAEVEKLCAGLVMSGFAMQAMGSSRPASGTEHQFSHYWDMEDLSFNGRPVSHGFKVGVGTLVSTAALEFLLGRDLAALDVDAAAEKWWPTFDALKATFPAVYGDRPAHIARAESEMAAKYTPPDKLRAELAAVKIAWPSLSAKMRGQIMPFGEVREALKTAGAPYEPEMIGVSRARLRETFSGVPYMRNRYFGLDLVDRLGLMPELSEKLFGAGGVWCVQAGR
ncbi:MAG: sn-glycerol-1-phosphate dehydrogenase [Kiritimatiellae bacterium]|nr:sn-glycerol-1-phosphate dehydrogenase [Kiritimatiellia bacterium]